MPATSEQECASSEVCKRGGYCTLINGACDAKPKDLSDETCAQSKECKAYGACKYSDDGCYTPAKSDKECVENDLCKFDARCSLVDGVCKNKSDADCAKSNYCRTWGMCTYIDGECRMSTTCKKGQTFVGGWCRDKE